MDCKSGKDEVCVARSSSTTPPRHPPTRHAAPPVFFSRRRVRLRALAPQQMRGGGAPSGAPALCSRLDRSAGAQISLRRATRSFSSAPASRRSTAASIRLRAALPGGEKPPPFRQRAPRSQALVPGGRCPGAARVRRATLAPRPQAPHPAAAGFLRNSRRKANRSLPGHPFRPAPPQNVSGDALTSEDQAL